MLTDKEIFSNWLKQKIKFESVITGKELADAVGIGPSTISGWFTGEKSKGPLPDVAQKICFIISKKCKKTFIYEDIIGAGRTKNDLNDKPQHDKIDECTTCPANNNNVYKIENALEGKHLNIIRQFKNKSMACSLNEALVELEALDDRELARVVSDVLDRIERLKAAKKRTANGQD